MRRHDEFPGPHPPARGKALVAAADARLRDAAFDRLATLGYRVDAVGDDRAVARRLEKDVYDLLVTDTLTVGAVPETTRVVRIEADRIDAVVGDDAAFDAAVLPGDARDAQDDEDAGEPDESP